MTLTGGHGQFQCHRAGRGHGGGAGGHQGSHGGFRHAADRLKGQEKSVLPPPPTPVGEPGAR